MSGKVLPACKCGGRGRKVRWALSAGRGSRFIRLSEQDSRASTRDTSRWRAPRILPQKRQGDPAGQEGTRCWLEICLGARGAPSRSKLSTLVLLALSTTARERAGVHVSIAGKEQGPWSVRFLKSRRANVEQRQARTTGANGRRKGQAPMAEKDGEQAGAWQVLRCMREGRRAGGQEGSRYVAQLILHYAICMRCRLPGD